MMMVKFVVSKISDLVLNNGLDMKEGLIVFKTFFQILPVKGNQYLRSASCF